MLSRITASWLIVLVLAPFTAPFPTCDLATFFGDGQTQHVPLPMTPPGSAALGSEAGVASVPAISHISRARLLQASSSVSSAVECFSATATLSRAATPASGLRDAAVLTTILRV